MISILSIPILLAIIGTILVFDKTKSSKNNTNNPKNL
tara:strand:+ start:1975 stop:2085 length:111 start_codon:yes stop_codon:yes gene_type:complete